MITENDKNRLSEMNGFEEDLRVDRIKDSIHNDSPYDADKESAIVRKMIHFLYTELNKTTLGDYSQNPVVQDFIKYYNDIEKIKAHHS